MAQAAIFRVPEGFEAEWEGARASATEVVLNAIRVGEALHAQVDALVRSFGVPSPTALIVLEVLRGEGGPLSPSEVAARCFLSRPALSGVLTTLEGRGYLRRKPDPDDRRRARVEITPEGREVMSRLLPALHHAEVDWTSGLSDGEQAVLLHCLGILHGHLQQAQEPSG